MKKLHLVACHVLWREFCWLAAESENVFTFCFLRQGLHDTPDKLRVEVQRAVDAAEADCEAVLLGYGLCSRGLDGVTARGKPLIVVRAHDCLTLLLGSKERYREYFDAHPGTYWYSPGWVDSAGVPHEDGSAKKRAEYVEKYGEENADYLLEVETGWMKRYSTIAYVDFGFWGTTRYKEFAKQLAARRGLEYDELQGEPRLMRDFLAGNWDAARFLVVRPGERIAAAPDERDVRIMEAERPPVGNAEGDESGRGGAGGGE